jgi:hypothetical protein
MDNYDVRRVSINLAPLIVFSIALMRGETGAHLTFTLRSFSYVIHLGMTALNKELR